MVRGRARAGQVRCDELQRALAKVESKEQLEPGELEAWREADRWLVQLQHEHDDEHIVRTKFPCPDLYDAMKRASAEGLPLAAAQRAEEIQQAEGCQKGARESQVLVNDVAIGQSLGSGCTGVVFEGKYSQGSGGFDQVVTKWVASPPSDGGLVVKKFNEDLGSVRDVRDVCEKLAALAKDLKAASKPVLFSECYGWSIDKAMGEQIPPGQT